MFLQLKLEVPGTIIEPRRLLCILTVRPTAILDVSCLFPLTDGDRHSFPGHPLWVRHFFRFNLDRFEATGTAHFSVLYYQVILS